MKKLNQEEIENNWDQFYKFRTFYSLDDRNEYYKANILAKTNIHIHEAEMRVLHNMAGTYGSKEISIPRLDHTKFPTSFNV